MTRKPDDLNRGYAAALKDILVLLDGPPERAVERVRTYADNYLADYRIKERQTDEAGQTAPPN